MSLQLLASDIDIDRISDLDRPAAGRLHEVNQRSPSEPLASLARRFDSRRNCSEAARTSFSACSRTTREMYSTIVSPVNPAAVRASCWASPSSRTETVVVDFLG